MSLLPIATAKETGGLAWRLVRRRPWLLTATVLSFAAAGLFALVPPWVLGQIVDIVRDGGDPDQLTVRVGVIVASSLLAGVFTVVSSVALAAVGEPALAELREQVLDEALALDGPRLEQAGSGDLLSRVGDDVRAVAESLVEIVPLVVGSAVAILLTGAGLFALDWRLGLAGLAAVPAYVMSLRWYLPRSGPFYKRERIAQGERAEALVNGLHGAPTLRAFRQERQQVAKVATASARAMQLSIDVFALLTRFFARTNRAEAVGLLLVLGMGFVLVRDDLATVGAVTAAALYFHRLFNPIGALLTTFDEVQSAGASLARLAGVALLGDRPHSLTRRLALRTDLVIDGVGHCYDQDRWVLADVHLQLEAGETVAVVGATGAGKTTLGAIAAGVLRPAAGELRVAGLATAADPETLRAHVALVSQEVHVFAGTVRDNVDMVRPGAGDAELQAALELTRAWPWVRALPDGLDTVVGDGAHPLTTAQAQQLALTRVVLLDPPVVVLDEATAEAGSSGARELESAARAVIEGRTALVIAHRLTQSQTADRVVVLHDGRVVEVGPHQELERADGRYAELWRAWSGAD